jgi:hypothetical protein
MKLPTYWVAAVAAALLALGIGQGLAMPDPICSEGAAEIRSDDGLFLACLLPATVEVRP